MTEQRPAAKITVSQWVDVNGTQAEWWYAPESAASGPQVPNLKSPLRYCPSVVCRGAASLLLTRLHMQLSNESEWHS